MDSSYDCIVIGAGPAGSTVAALVAQAGYRTLLLEREKLPRFHVGESLMPETYWIFRRLGVLEQMKSSSFVSKVSVQFVSSTGRESQPFFFPDHDPRECSRTWQVERGPFDQMLVENATAQGAECHDQTRVLEVIMEQSRAVGVRLQSSDRSSVEIRASVVVDASGQQTLLAGALGLKRVNPNLRKAAIWGYYRDARRDPGEHGGATIILHTKTKDSWFWFIPLANGITSIGVVGDNEFLLKGRGRPSDVFREELSDCSSLADRLGNAKVASRFHVAKEFSYTTQKAAGDGWVLVGDAWGFIDPIYSSGVYFALKSAEMAADCITEGLAQGDTSARQLGKWSDEFTAGTQWIRKLVDAFYTRGFSMGRFLKSHPEHGGRLTDLLIGRIFSPGVGDVFKDMDPWLRGDGEMGRVET